MNPLSALFFAALITTSAADGWYERWSNAGATWEERWSKLLDEAPSMPPMERIEVMSRALPNDTQPIKNAAHRELVERIRSTLLGTSGHAEFFAKRIKAQQAELEDALKGTSTDRTGTAKAKLLEEQMYGFATLQVMPSPETVRVLGEFLYDSWGLRPNLQPGEYPDLDEEGITSHSWRALVALAALPLAHKPVQPRPNRWVDYHQDIDAWKLWYEQVRAGTRTFRFIGDPQEYNLQGPVAAAIEPTPARPPRPADVVPPTPVEVSARPARRTTTIAISIALLLLVAAAWRALRSRRKGGLSAR